MHRYALEITPIRQDNVGMKFQASLAKAPKYTNDVLAIKQMANRHA
jgi:hypothetical protein